MAKQPANPAAQAITDTTAALRGVVSALQPIASMGGTPAGAIAAAGGQLAKLSAGMGPVAAAAGGFVGVAAQLPQLFKSAADGVAQYVAAFSPATAARYSQAWSDLSASIGEQLLPVLDMATGVVRFFGDVVAGLTPVIRPVIDQVTQIYSAFGGAFKDVFNELIKAFVILEPVLSPVRELIVNIFTGQMQLMTWGLKEMAKYLKVATNALALFFGVEVPKVEGASYGKAAASVTTTNTDSLLRQLREKSFALGKSGGEDNPARETVNWLEKLWTWVVNELPKLFTKYAADVTVAIQNAINQLRAAANAAQAGLEVGTAGVISQGQNILNNIRQVVPGIPSFAGP